MKGMKEREAKTMRSSPVQCDPIGTQCDQAESACQSPQGEAGEAKGAESFPEKSRLCRVSLLAFVRECRQASRGPYGHAGSPRNGSSCKGNDNLVVFAEGL